MRIGCPLLAIGILCLMPSPSMAQEVQPYVKNQVKVDWVRGTDFSKYKTYAWGDTQQMTPDPKHTIEGIINAALQAKGLQEVGKDANPRPHRIFQRWKRAGISDSELHRKSSR